MNLSTEILILTFITSLYQRFITNKYTGLLQALLFRCRCKPKGCMSHFA
jgi:hypothetical protein